MQPHKKQKPLRPKPKTSKREGLVRITAGRPSKTKREKQ